MQYEDKIILCLNQLTDTVGRLDQRIDLIDQKIGQIDQKIDTVEESLNRRMDKLEARIDEVEEGLSRRIDEVKVYLDDKIDMIEKALDTEIDKVYQIACKNEYSIEMLLFPYNDRNLHVNDELEKMSRYDERMDEIEAVLESHSDAIHKLQLSMA